MDIAIDFDGTIVEHKFPAIGKEMDGAFDTMKDLQKAGFNIIIWTCRDDEYIDDIKEFFEENDFEPDAINENVDKTLDFAKKKIVADVYIDDRNFGGFPGWDIVRDYYLSDNMFKD